MQFTNLPEETVVCVLQQLPLDDLLTSRAVSSALKRLIDSSLLLQYRIALGTHGLVDNPACALSSVRKLGELRSGVRSWYALDFARLGDRRRAERRRKRQGGATDGGQDKRKGKGRRKAENEFSTTIPVHNFAAVYDLADGCFFQDLNRDWPFRSPSTVTPADGAPDTQELHPEGVSTTLTTAESSTRFQARSSTLAWLALPSRRTLDLDDDDDGIPRPDSALMPSTLEPAATATTAGYTPTWYTAAFDFKVSDICVDVERDLLVVFERRDALDYVKTTTETHIEHVWDVRTALHFLSLSKSSTRHATSPLSLSSTARMAHDTNTNAAADGITRHLHPDAAQPSLLARTIVTCHSYSHTFPHPHHAPGAVEYAMTAHLAGDFVGVLLSSCTRCGAGEDRAGVHAHGTGAGSNESDWFWLWDWVHGTCLFRMESGGREQWDTFCFVGAHALMIPDAMGSGSGALNVFFFDDHRASGSASSAELETCAVDEDENVGCASAKGQTSPFRHVLSLLLPETVHAHAVAQITCRSEPPPSGRGRGRDANDSAPPSESKPQAAAPPPPPFSADPDEAVIILNIDYLVRPRRPNTRRVPVHGVQAQYLPFRQDGGGGGAEADGIDGGGWTEAELEQEGIALVVDGLQISLAHPQVVALRRKDVMRWARAADASILHTAHAVPRTETHAAAAMRAEEWVRRSRWGLGPPPARWVCCAHGARFVSMEDRPLGSARRVGVRVYDFNARTIGRARRGLSLWLEESEEDDAADDDDPTTLAADAHPQPYPIKRTLINSAPTRVHLPEIFRAPFSCALPYRLVETEAVFDWDSCLLDGERIVGLVEEEAEPGALKMLEVLVL